MEDTTPADRRENRRRQMRRRDQVARIEQRLAEIEIADALAGLAVA